LSIHQNNFFRQKTKKGYLQEKKSMSILNKKEVIEMAKGWLQSTLEMLGLAEKKRPAARRAKTSKRVVKKATKSKSSSKKKKRR
jgi:hypothetical protein